MRCLCFAAILACLAGCAEDKIHDVSGTVMHGDVPLPAGIIWFDPDPKHPAQPPQGYAYIKDGKFDTLDKGRGVKSGAYLIRVEGFDGKPGNELPLGKPLFTDYHENREFPGGKVELEIKIPKKSEATPPAAKPRP